jgi:hypothetical protein
MNRKIEFAALLALFLFAAPIINLFPGLAFDAVTIVGEVNNTNQIIADGEIYEVDDSPQGDDLVKSYIGRKVKVTGKLRIEGDMRILEVTAFEVVKE